MSEKLHALLAQKEGESWLIFFLRRRNQQNETQETVQTPQQVPPRQNFIDYQIEHKALPPIDWMTKNV